MSSSEKYSDTCICGDWVVAVGTTDSIIQHIEEFTAAHANCVAADVGGEEDA